MTAARPEPGSATHEPPALLGCGDHSCVVRKPQGMGTNAGCRCEAPTLRRALKAERARADAAEKRAASLEAELADFRAVSRGRP